MMTSSKIFVAGHKGLVGSSIYRQLQQEGFTNIVVKERTELDLLNEEEVFSFLEDEKPEYVILAAAKVGGIHANNVFRADFLYENLKIQNNVIWGSFKSGVRKLLFLGSSCIYPKMSHQPIRETELLTGPLEFSNEPYALAKIAGIKLCESLNLQYGTNFISCMPTNMYGPNDNFDFKTSHVLPAILRKIVLAKWFGQKRWDHILENLETTDRDEAERQLNHYGIYSDKVVLWGTGTPRREFLYSDDLARACTYLMKHVDFSDVAAKHDAEVRNTHINVGYGSDLTIRELAELIARIVEFEGEISFDASKPDGTPRKLMDSSKIFELGWKPEITLEEGIRRVYTRYFEPHLVHP